MTKLSDNSHDAYIAGIEESWRQLREAIYRFMRGWTIAEREGAKLVVDALTPVVMALNGLSYEKTHNACLKRLNKDGRL